MRRIKKPLVVDVSIIGGGLSGLHTALLLSKAGLKCAVYEARERYRGRISSRSVDSSTQKYDLGPSWYWPGQVGIETLVRSLDIADQVFKQYALGDALFESAGQGIQRGVQGISMNGSNRLKLGLVTIINRLIEQLSQTSCSLINDTAVTGISYHDDFISVSASKGEICRAKQVVIALPPRVALRDIVFSPSLASTRRKELSTISTWMAGHAKAVIVYKKAFWRIQGLSGDVYSQIGPLSEIHDASLCDESSAALFGFFSTPPVQRTQQGEKLERLLVKQLVRIFGDAASHPIAVLYKDWASDLNTATALDQHAPNHHPLNELSNVIEAGWSENLIWSGTETAKGHVNGYLEGAVQSSLECVEIIKRKKRSN